MKRIDSLREWAAFKAKLREACAKPSQLGQEELLTMLEDAAKAEMTAVEVEDDGCRCGQCIPCTLREYVRKAEEAARLDSGRHHGG